MKYIKLVPYVYDKDIVPDFVVGYVHCILYLSIKYHLLEGKYIFTRIAELNNDYKLRILLVYVDVSDNSGALKDLARICFKFNLTLVLAFSLEEAARYIETYKLMETKSPDLIKERIHEGEKLSDILTVIKSVNKTDAVTLSTNFGNFRNIIKASMEELSLCPGLGETKVRRIHEAFHQPFNATKKPKSVLDPFLVKK